MTRRRSTFPAGEPADPDELQVEFDRRLARLLIASSANLIPINAAWLVCDSFLLPDWVVDCRRQTHKLPL
jgi:hypothetical protein